MYTDINIMLNDSNYSENVLLCAAGTCETDNEPDDSDVIEHSDWINLYHRFRR
jgi:hypothetical protein